MSWLESIDVAVFRFINLKLGNDLCDALMPFFNTNPYLAPAVAIGVLLLFWKGGVKGWVFVLMLLLLTTLGEDLVVGMLKRALGRARPFRLIEEAQLRIGIGSSGSLPSGHASLWFASAMIAYVFYRRTRWILLPLACTVAFSRVYLGVHYPSDVLAGALLGAGYALAGLWAANELWHWIGRSWFPLAWQRLPILVPFHGERIRLQPAPASPPDPIRIDRQWLRFGCVFIAAVLIGRLTFLASDLIELSKDEAYQWLWSKHLALSYYSKPPLIAFIQFAGTSLWGDNEFGVRFFSPVFAALLGIVLLRFVAQIHSARLGVILLLVVNAVPLMALGTVLMTIDPPLVLCWMLALVAGWRAVQPDGTTTHWLLVGAAMGLGFLSKYAAAFQWVCWALFFVLYRPARLHLRRPGPYLALLINALGTLPVIIWNAQHDWATLGHVAYNAGVSRGWQPTLRYFWDFLFSQLALLNPIFFLGALCATVGAWKQRRDEPLWLYLLCFGAPVFFGYWLFSFHKRILPNWIAPAVLPMFTLMVLFWEQRRRAGVRWVRPLFMVALILGYAAVALLHTTAPIRKLAGKPLPPEKEPLRRVRAWKQTTDLVDRMRVAFETLTQQPVFIISDHYGMAGQFTFYLPEARAALTNGPPLVYALTTPTPENQFYFWPEYRYRENRPGQDAIFVSELDPPALRRNWVWHWLKGKTDLRASTNFPAHLPPPQLQQEFEAVTYLGLYEVHYRGYVYRRLHLYFCRNLRPVAKIARGSAR